MPSFNLEKGSKFQLDKGIRSIRAGLGWDAGFDLDACVFGLRHDASGKPRFFDADNASHAVFYGNRPLKQPDGSFRTHDGSIVHYGDNRTGDVEGDDEVIEIDLAKLPDPIREVSLIVTIYKAREKRLSFGAVKNSYVRVTDTETGEELCQYRLRDEFADAMSVHVGSFMKADGGNWVFQALGYGYPVEIGDILAKYE